MIASIIFDILPVAIAVSLLYLIEKLFYFKEKLRSRFISRDSYRVTFLLIIVLGMIVFSFLSKKAFLSHPIGSTLFFSCLYLAHVSKEE
ncbi:MAG: hypothetical protein AB2421_04600 [Thermotaleaceae bacterium]